MIFVAGALISQLSFGPAGRSRSFLGGTVLFALAAAAMRGGVSPLFLGLFVAATLLCGLGSRGGSGARRLAVAGVSRSTPNAFALFAASDVALALAITQHQAHAGVWDLPGTGDWSRGALLVGLASVLRLAAPVLERPGGSSLLGWWQGVFLAWWVGRPAGPLFLIAGGALVVVGALAPRRGRGESGFALAGGLIALLAAAGASEGGFFILGLAGCALVLGERAVAAFTLAALPFSAAWVATGSVGVGFVGAWAGDESPAVGVFIGAYSDRTLMMLVAVAAPVLFLLVARVLMRSGPPGWGGRMAALVAGAGGALLTAREVALASWAVYAVGGAALFMLLFTRPTAAALPKSEPAPAGLLPEARVGVRLLGWLALSLAAALWLRLLVIGTSTGFL